MVRTIVLCKKKDLCEYAEVDLEPLGGGLVSGAPGELVGQVEASVSVGTTAVPLGRVDGRRRQLAVVYGARCHAQRPRLPARYTDNTASSNYTTTV